MTLMTEWGTIEAIIPAVSAYRAEGPVMPVVEEEAPKKVVRRKKAADDLGDFDL